GHNEADEPSATQPVMYGRIRNHKTTRELYAEKLLAAGVLEPGEAERRQEAYRDRLDHGEPVPKSLLGNIGHEYTVDWSRYFDTEWDAEVDTTVPAGKVAELAAKITTVPPGLVLHGRVQRIMQERARMAKGEIDMDWGFAEAMAFATLIDDGFDCRLTGQDTSRGTFFHRHAVLHNQRNRDEYIPLQTISDRPSSFRVIDSLLSEEAVLGFEYGYATTEPRTLVIWEAQFGDFANGAQVVIDQFITSGEAKWGRMCGLVMFLPHGYEGQGPEHSSARLERYLQLCAEHNIQVCVPSTPAQIFHLLRRQMLRPFRKPLVVMTPKSLLRRKEASSQLAELAEGCFQTVISEVEDLDPQQVTRIIATSGRIYYDLAAARRERGADHVAIIRVEQLYPFPHEHFAAEMRKYPKAKEVVWCQEEPQNQGAWYQTQHYFLENIREDQKLYYAGRMSSASPAVGYLAKQNEQQKNLLDMAFGPFKN